jgi:ectoine hydroxylase-related dioxygenase (phytanoyl-CoA dioxygenase family)
MLSEAEINAYHRDGYVTPDFRLPTELVEWLRQRHTLLLEKHPQFSQYCSALLAYDTGFLKAAQQPQILDMVCQLIGDNIALWNSSFFAKPANNGHETPWHQDGEYWPIKPLATCTVWIALDHATTENGCLQVIPGSHKSRRLLQHHTNNSDNVTLNQELDSNSFDNTEAHDITLEPGQVSLHDVYLVHGSGANQSPNSRRGMTLRFMPTTSVYNRELARDFGQKDTKLSLAERTLYLMRGTDVSGKNDFSVRH